MTALLALAAIVAALFLALGSAKVSALAPTRARAAHLRNGDSPSLLAPALAAGLLVAAYLVVLFGVRP